MTRTAAFASSAAMLALIGGLWYITGSPGVGDAFAQCRRGVASGDIGGPFELVNAQGATVTDADVLTKPSLVYFGYTFCPDVCPFDVARNADAADLLIEQGYSVAPVFISIDPQRDTPEVVGEYASAMHPDMIGLTGSPEQVKAASKAYRTYYKAQPAEDDYYLVDHSTFTYLVLPEVGFVDFFRREMTPEDMAERTACFLDAQA